MSLPSSFNNAFYELAARVSPDGFRLDGRVFKTKDWTPLNISYINFIHAVGLGLITGGENSFYITDKGRKFAAAVDFAKTGLSP